MSEFIYTVVVDAENKEQADKVMRERLDYDEDYGETYKIRYSANWQRNPSAPKCLIRRLK